MDSKPDFSTFFEQLTGHKPMPWQERLATESTNCRSRLIRIPTGLGKTQGVLFTWFYHRILLRDQSWPRRLVWCLPMRVLVEQTAQVAQLMTERIPGQPRPNVHISMGGEDAGEWHLFPEQDAIIVGTQDMLLSRALNRGYASPRGRWPREFGLLNQDALWVMDEVQLMDVGLATSAQLQWMRGRDRKKSLRPCFTWWMSATLQSSWLKTVDTRAHHRLWIRNPCGVPSGQRTGGLWNIPKSATTATIAPDNHDGFAKRILQEHAKLSNGEFGKITLVVCNTVDRACRTFDALRTAGRTDGLELVHSRFRPAERDAWREQFLSRTACTSGVDRIIVATQVVEAGVDISAGCLITELAPWPSLVQRFGRCARYEGSGSVLVVDRGRDEKQSAPYQPKELESAWETIQQLHDVGIKALEAHEESLGEETRQRLYPYAPAHLLLRKEFDELFDTTPDLTGADLDISRFIRSDDKERDLQVFWLEIDKDKKGEKPRKPSDDYRPHRKELCAVPFLKVRDWLCEKDKSKLKASKRAWVWDWLDGEWKPATREAMLPGWVVCIAADSGGYLLERGFSADSNSLVTTLESETINSGTEGLEEADGQSDQEIPGEEWKTIACHTQEVANQVKAVARELGLPARLQDLLELAALWHDWGKAHPAFQNMLRRKRHDAEPFKSYFLAKSKKIKPSIRAKYFVGENETDERCGYRHELASALGLFALLDIYSPKHDALLGPWVDVLATIKQPLPERQPPPPPTRLIERLLKCKSEEFDLVAYLVASHHGKVRVGLHAAPKDQDYRERDGRGLPIRGIREGDRLPSVELVPGEPPVPEVSLTLSPAALGLSCRTGISWRERCIGLMERHGPATLAFLEAILRAADARASRLTTNDPALALEGDV